MLTHDQINFYVTQAYPEMVPGKDFIAGQPISRETGEQTADASIFKWVSAHPKPTVADLMAWDLTYRAAEKSSRLALFARSERKSRMAIADVLFNKALESRDEIAISAATTYRQELRDVTKQPGFPDRIFWPAIPSQLGGFVPAG